MDLHSELTELLTALDAGEIEYALCGKPAMAVYALPRATNLSGKAVRLRTT